MRYRTPDVFRLGRSVLPYSAGNSGPTYSFTDHLRTFDYGTVALFGPLFQAGSSRYVEVLPVPHLRTVARADSVRPVPVSLAGTSGIAFAFFSCPYYDVSVQGVPFPGLGVPDSANFRGEPPTSARVSGTACRDAERLRSARSRIRKPPDRRLHASSRGISLLAASFFGAGAKSSSCQRMRIGQFACRRNPDTR